MLRAISDKHPLLPILWAAAGIWVSALRAELPINVSSTVNFAVAAGNLASVTSHGMHVINIYGSNNLGQFKLDALGSINDTLVFQRPGAPTPLESDSAIQVDSTLLIIKQWKGPVILKGLAFELRSASSVLIAGAETGKENGNLILDSCMIYASDLDGSFLNWLTSATSSIEIRRSFFVAKNASTRTKMSLTAGTIKLFNNLFNYPGTITAVTNVSADIESNTFNRTQIQLGAVLSPGLGTPRYQFNRNLIAHKGDVDILTGWKFAFISGYSEIDAVIQNNRIYQTWSGFDVNNSVKFAAAGNNNLFIDTIAGKPASELWNWYVPGDTLVGFANGTLARSSRYNIMPGISSFSPDSVIAQISFTPSNFPRQIIQSFVPDSLPIFENPDLWFIYPTRGSLHFGPFYVTNLTLNINPVYGKPVLLSRDVSGKFTRQKVPDNSCTTTPCSFANGSPSARYFAITFLGNTPGGVRVTPSLAMAFPDTLVFKKVDSSGQTKLSVDQNHVFPKELRNLGRRVWFTTTATLTDSVYFGTRDSILPYDSSKVFWMQAPTNTLIPNQAEPSLGNRWVCKFPATRELSVFLVEKLSVPAGGKTFSLGKWSLKATSLNGYQLSVDSSGSPDPGFYGIATHVYKPKWVGRGDLDTLTLTFPGKAEQDVFSIQGGSVTLLNNVLQPDSTFQISIPKADSGQGYFAGLRYNVFAGAVLNQIVDGYSISNFLSSKPGRLRIVALDNSIRAVPIPKRDTVFTSTRFLGGAVFQKYNLYPTLPWDFNLPLTGMTNPTGVEIWVAGDSNSTWAQIRPAQTQFGTTDSLLLHVSGIPSDTKWIVAVERLPALDTLIKLKLNVDSVVARTLEVTPTSSDSLNRHVQGYRLELKEVDQFGNVMTNSADSVPIGASSKVSFLPGSAYAYRILYYSNQQPYGDPKYIPVPGISWMPNAVMNKNDMLRGVNSWQLIGFPVTGKLGDLFKSHNSQVKDTAKRDVTFFLRIKNIALQPGGTRIGYDTIPEWETSLVTPGKACLFAAAKPYSFALLDTSKFLPLLPDTVSSKDTGWQFIANPFPATVSVSKISSNKQTTLPFYRLDSSSQTFIPASVIQAFQGYAYHFKRDEKLVFNLLSDGPVGPKRSATPSILQASMDALGQHAQMDFSTDPEANVPYLSGLKPYLQMRIGVGGGFFVKSVERPWEIDEPVTVITAQATLGAFHLRPKAGLDGLAAVQVPASINPGFSALLIDLATGKTFDQAQAETLPLGPGSSQFRLIAGSPGYVQSRLLEFLSSVPRTIGMSQNFPNPCRGLTRISLDWPITNAQDRHAVLEALDLRGRILKSLDIRNISVGRQVVFLDASDWMPGIYIYRLSVYAGGNRSQLEKRMLVVP